MYIDVPMYRWIHVKNYGCGSGCGYGYDVGMIWGYDMDLINLVCKYIYMQLLINLGICDVGHSWWYIHGDMCIYIYDV